MTHFVILRNMPPSLACPFPSILFISILKLSTLLRLKTIRSPVSSL